jgi:hypothetical protein
MEDLFHETMVIVAPDYETVRAADQAAIIELNWFILPWFHIDESV